MLSPFSLKTLPLALTVALAALVALPGAEPAAAATTSKNQVKETAQSKMPYGKGLLWKIEKKGIEPSWVFGTMHVSDKRIKDLPNEVEAAFRRARSLSVEVIPSYSLAYRSIRASLLEDGKSLEVLLGPELFKSLSILGRQYGVSPRWLSRMKPSAVMDMLMGVPAPSDDPPGRVLDAELIYQAEKRELRVYPLETVRDRVEIFGSLAEEDQIDSIRRLVDRFPDVMIDADLTRMKYLYLDRDIEAILEMQDEWESVLRPRVQRFVDRQMLDVRNVKMVDRVVPRLEEGRAFVAVGAAHLPGNKGVLQLLEKAGYKVTRVY